MGPDDLLRDLPGYPFTAWALVILVGLGYLAKTVRERPQRQAKTNANLGGRLQAVEQALQLADVRRLQVEHELQRVGLRLPYWPGDTAAAPPTVQPLHSLDDDDQADDDDATSLRPTIPPLPDYPQHSRKRHTA
ncbi:MAG: hypothetical protein ACLGI3_16850 [Actinomycetes bacterium]